MRLPQPLPTLILSLLLPMLACGCASTGGDIPADPLASPRLAAALEQGYQDSLAGGHQEVRLGREWHGLSADLLSPAAREVVEAILGDGHEVYVVGGLVRDRLLGQPDRGVDLVTSASLADLSRLFGEEWLEPYTLRGVGYASLFHGGEDIQLSFLAPIPEAARGLGGVPSGQPTDKSSRLLHDTYWRDFTVNSVYLDLRTSELVDFHGGLHDLRDRVIRRVCPGEVPMTSEQVIRALRMVTIPGTRLDPSLEAQLRAVGRSPRLDPYGVAVQLPLLLGRGSTVEGLRALQEYGLMAAVLPPLDRELGKGRTAAYLKAVAEGIDAHYAAERYTSPALLMAALLSPAVEARATRLGAEAAIRAALREEARAFDFAVGGYGDEVGRLLGLSHRLLSGKAPAAGDRGQRLEGALAIARAWAQVNPRARRALGRLANP
ncbi:MAG: hypothetical protein K6A65_00050 [Succinivibrionaceae bacterium]|nr:hypothetical protein [Succinivibrionaceae bacterium]